MICPVCQEELDMIRFIDHLDKNKSCTFTIERAKLIGLIDQNDISIYNDTIKEVNLNGKGY